MDGRPLNQIVQHLRRAAANRAGGDVSDAHLLARFVTTREPDAFATIVRRHGPMVLGVCKRLLRDHHAAEDAFQATFLVFLRKAGSIRRREQVSNWLYGVAYRTALKARTRAARRREQPLEDVAVTAPVAEVVWRELRPVLDEEISRLPGKYRRPVVLHYLEGKTRRETARQLGWPEGTVSVRLARAREWMRRRLERRGLALSAGALAVVLAQVDATAAVPASLSSATAQLALAGASAIPGEAAVIAEGVMRAMLFAKLKAAAATAAVCLGVAAFGFTARATVVAHDGETPVAQAAADV